MKIIEWSDPWPGLDEDGNEVTCTHTSRITEVDAIKVARYNYRKLRPGRPMPPSDILLDGLIVTNWATIKEVPDDSLN